MIFKAKRPHCGLYEVNTDLHIDGCVPPDKSPLVAVDPVVVHTVPSIQDGPVGGQLDHHILSGVTARGLIHLCRIRNQETAGVSDVYYKPSLL